MQAKYVLASVRSCGAETLRPTLHCFCGVSIDMMHTVICTHARGGISGRTHA